MTGGLVIRYLLLALLAFPVQLGAQCPAAADFMNRLSALHSDASIPVNLKIKKLEALLHLRRQCQTSEDSVVAAMLHRLGSFYALTGDLDKALALTREAIDINGAYRPGALRSYLANSYLNLGIYHRRLGQFEASQQSYDSCIAIGRQFPQNERVALMAYADKAFYYYEVGDYQKSISIADKGVAFAREKRNEVYEAVVQLQRIQSGLALNDVGGAEEELKRIISVLSANPDYGSYLATASFVFADMLAGRQRHKEAIPYYRKAFALDKGLERWDQCSRDMLALGFLYDEYLKHAPAARECYLQAIALGRKANAPYLIASIYNNIGLLCWRQHDYDRALHYYQAGLNALPVQFTDTSVYRNPEAGQLKFATNNYFIYLLLSNKGESLLHRYKAYGNQADLRYALQTFLAADQSVDLMRRKQYGDQSKLYWRENTRILYRNAIEACYLLQDKPHAFYFFEKSRAVLLTDKLNESGARRFLAAGDQAREQQLHADISVLQQQLNGMSENHPSYEATKQKLLYADEAQEQFIRSLEDKYPVYYHYKYGNAIPPLQGIQQHLAQEKQSLVSLFTDDTVVYVLALSGGSEALLEVPFKEYHHVVRELLQLCSDKSLLNRQYDRYRRAAYQLYTHLFQPLQLPKGRVVISPDDYFIPFEALLTDSGSGNSFLVKDYAFSYTYSAGFLLQPNGHQSSEATFLGIAPVHFRSYLSQPVLAGSDRSLEMIKPLFRKSRLLMYEAATRRQFLDLLPSYGIVQLYTHAVADSTGKEPALYLNDSVIYLSELQAIRNVQTDLIVLSACRTGVGRNALGEGVFSLSRGFAAAGIPSTVTTLWQIDNQATYPLTEAFYKYLSQGLPKDEALQRAKLEFMQTQDRLNELPYFWAAHTLVGKTERCDIGHPRNNYAWFALAGCILLIAIFFLLRRRFAAAS